jgi:hypothetical protein
LLVQVHLIQLRLISQLSSTSPSKTVFPLKYQF